MQDTCIMCGSLIPEGSQVCATCIHAINTKEITIKNIHINQKRVKKNKVKKERFY